MALAQVSVTPAESAAATLRTDAHGQSVVGLKQGAYSLSVSDPGFKTQTRQVEVGPGQTSAGLAILVTLQVATNIHGMVVAAGDALVLTDDLRHASAVLTPADFRALQHVSITAHNGHSGSDEAYSGVQLSTLLAKINAPMGNALRGNAMTTYVIATGSDGYAVLLSLAEVDPDFHENQVIVADGRDGQPLRKGGPFQLIVPGDKRPARWVHNLVSITVEQRQVN